MSAAETKQVSYATGSRAIALNKASKWYPTQEDSAPKKVGFLYMREQSQIGGSGNGFDCGSIDKFGVWKLGRGLRKGAGVFERRVGEKSWESKFRHFDKMLPRQIHFHRATDHPR